MAFYVYENRINSEAIVHRGECSFCKEGRGVHGRNTTNSSSWLGPFATADEALATARSRQRERTDACLRCSPM